MSEVSGRRASSHTTAHNDAVSVRTRITQENSDGLDVKAVISNYTKKIISNFVRNYKEKTPRHPFVPEFFPMSALLMTWNTGLSPNL